MWPSRASRARWPRADFLPRPKRSPLLAWVWLLFSVSVLAVAFDDWTAVEAARDELRGRAAAVRLATRPDAAPASTAPAPLGAAVAARRVVQGLDHPWHTLFEGPERYAPRAVRWLRLEHDAERGEVRLEGEAPDRDTALETADSLARAPRWSDVTLLRIEAAGAAAPGAGVRFELRAHQGDEAQP
ncbi:MAG: hypothetical protein KGI90_07770 [Burkholderiales bacterium]|nr:hypothetical protein [Burkholderiales bacterium]